MNIQDLSSLAAVVLAISVATERLVTVLKTSFPGWFSDEQRLVGPDADAFTDRWRRLRVLAFAFGSSWTAAASLAQGGFDLLGQIGFGTSGGHLPVPLLGLLATGGSAFWSNVVSYSSTAKDLRALEKSTLGAAKREQAERQALATGEFGAVARKDAVEMPGGPELLQRVLRASQPVAEIPLSDVLRNLVATKAR